MKLRFPWQGSASEEKPRGPKTVNIFFGFFFVVNFCLGTGFLGIPYGFFYAGFPAAIPTLLVIAFISWNTATWEIEVMARAQAVESFKRFRRRQTDPSALGSGSSSSESKGGGRDLSQSVISDTSLEPDCDVHPKFRILLTRKFEPTELCEVFFNRWVKYLYLLVMTIYSFLTGWSYATVAGSAWATNIPFDANLLKKCADDAFQHDLIPGEGSCVSAYRLCLLFFAVIVVTLAVLDLKEQAVVQMILGTLRFATIVAIILYSVLKLIEGDDPCDDPCDDPNYEGDSGSGSGSGGSLNQSIYILSNSTTYHHDIVSSADVNGWLIAIPVFTYAFIIHQGIPSLTHPIKQKQFLRWFIVCMFGVAAASYLALGITVSLYFRESIQETATLNWVRLSESGHSPQLRALSYYLVLFPSLDVCSAYPLVVHTITNNIYTVVTGRDSSKKAKHRFGRYDLLIQLVMRFFAAVIPIVAALFVSNLVQVLKYAGIMGFWMCFFFPTALQLQSQRVCKKLFSQSYVVSKEEENGMGPEERTEKAPLLSLQEKAGGGHRLYMTPYSNRLLSHPVTVSILGSMGVVLFVLAVASLFLHPDTYTCASYVG